MKGAYDDLPQETWGRADADMPQEYVDAILARYWRSVRLNAASLKITRKSKRLARNFTQSKGA